MWDIISLKAGLGVSPPIKEHRNQIDWMTR